MEFSAFYFCNKYDSGCVVSDQMRKPQGKINFAGPCGILCRDYAVDFISLTKKDFFNNRLADEF